MKNIILLVLFTLAFIHELYKYIRLMLSKVEVDCKTCRKELYLWRTVVYTVLVLKTFEYAFPEVFRSL